MTSTDSLTEAMMVHRRFTLLGEGGLRRDPEGTWTTYRHLQERVAAERAVCVELLRTAGCVCRELDCAYEAERDDQPPQMFSFDGFITDDGTLVEHDPRCPVALANKIEAASAATDGLQQAATRLQQR